MGAISNPVAVNHASYVWACVSARLVVWGCLKQDWIFLNCWVEVKEDLCWVVSHPLPPPRLNSTGQGPRDWTELTFSHFDYRLTNDFDSACHLWTLASTICALLHGICWLNSQNLQKADMCLYNFVSQYNADNNHRSQTTKVVYRYIKPSNLT